eukprot:8362136-Karenia_brevis.AAC.1
MIPLADAVSMQVPAPPTKKPRTGTVDAWMAGQGAVALRQAQGKAWLSMGIAPATLDNPELHEFLASLVSWARQSTG